MPWRSLAARVALALIPGWITLAALVYHVGWPTKIIVGGTLAVSAIDPIAGFLVVVALAPVGHLVAIEIAVENFRMTEAVALAFFTGWLLHGWIDRDGPRMPRAIGTLFACAVLASIVGLAWQLAGRPGELSRDVDLLVHAYNIADDRIGVTIGFRLIEGVALAAAFVTLFRHRPRFATVVPAVLSCGGVATAAASWLLWYDIAPAAVLRDHARNGYRIVAHVVDANAAGSGFAMLTCLSVGMAVGARGRARVWWVVAAAANASGVWLSASRSALGVTVAGTSVLIVWAAARLRSRLVAAIAAAAVVGAAIAGGGYLWRASRDQLSRGSSLRAQFNETSERMIAQRPMVGIGIGQYRRLSSLFMTPQLAWFYGSENAHDYFMQIAAELGLPGFALFAMLFVAALWRAGRAAAAAPGDLRLVGVACGVLAFLATALVSHPFLVDEVAVPFWIQLGLLFGLAGAIGGVDAPVVQPFRAAAVSIRRPKGLHYASVALVSAAIVYVVLSPVLRVWQGETVPPIGSAIDGFYDWETDSEGTRYRWTGEYASVLVPPDVAAVDVPIRVPEGIRGLSGLLVMPSIDGRHWPPAAARPTWTTITIEMPRSSDPTRMRRVNLRVIPGVWQPALHIAGNGDLRHVGVEVGECAFRR